MSLLLKNIMPFMSFMKNFGKIMAPIKNDMNAMIKVTVKLLEIGLNDNAKKAAKTIKTTNGLKT